MDNLQHDHKGTNDAIFSKENRFSNANRDKGTNMQQEVFSDFYSIPTVLQEEDEEC